MDKNLVITFPPNVTQVPPIYCGQGFAMRRTDGLWECKNPAPTIYCDGGMAVMRRDGLWACQPVPPAGPVCTASIVYSQEHPSQVRIGAQDSGVCDAGLEIALAAVLAALLKGP